MSSANGLCKQFRPRSGPSKRQARSGSERFDTPMLFLKEIFEKEVYFEKKSAVFCIGTHGYIPLFSSGWGFGGGGRQWGGGLLGGGRLGRCRLGRCRLGGGLLRRQPALLSTLTTSKK